MKLLVLYFTIILGLLFQNISANRKNRKCHLRKHDESCLSIRTMKIIDGNTVTVNYTKLGKFYYQTLHLFAVSTPRLNETFGIKSKEHLEKLLEKKKIVIAKIKKERSINGQFIGILYSGKTDINKKMIMDGYAWCKNPVKCPQAYYRATNRAIKLEKGIWKINKSLKSKKTGKSKSSNDNKLEKGEYSIIIKSVIDGDTVYAKLINSQMNSIIKIRMGGIDAPEMKQSFGIDAKNKLNEIINNLPNKQIKLRVEATDIYGRSIGYLVAGNFDINKAMVEKGYAWCYRYIKCPTSYQVAMNNAKTQRLGLFVQTNPTTPWDWRKANKRIN